MPKFSHETLRDVGRRIYAACGAPAEEAALVTDVLVDANLMGHDSHGISQTSFYVADYHLGKIVPGAMIETEKGSDTAAVLNGNKNFGIVAATRATELAVEKAKQHHAASSGIRRSDTSRRVPIPTQSRADKRRNLVGR